MCYVSYRVDAHEVVMSIVKSNRMAIGDNDNKNDLVKILTFFSFTIY